MTKLENGYVLDGMNEIERNVKRILDFFAAGISLIVFSPLFLVCYILVKREDGGPAIFKQQRIGRFGRPFNIYKFRSMKVDAEKDGPALFQHENETRMTKIGKFLREHHLDELPQLWNVFKGDMAFIGPRPEREYYIKQIMERDHRYVYLYQIRPGVTSYAWSSIFTTWSTVPGGSTSKFSSLLLSILPSGRNSKTVRVLFSPAPFPHADQNFLNFNTISSFLRVMLPPSNPNTR